MTDSLSKDYDVASSVIDRICQELKCDVGDMMEVVLDDPDKKGKNNDLPAVDRIIWPSPTAKLETSGGMTVTVAEFLSISFSHHMEIRTDYVSNSSSSAFVVVLQAKAGAWIDEFVEASDKPGFNMTNYLGADAIEAATWYDSLTAA